MNMDEHDRSIHGPLVEKIKSLFQGFGDILVRAVRRMANGSTHVLAKEGCDNKFCKVWNCFAPDFVKNKTVTESVMS
jgi:hypothetical protein